MQGGVSLSPEIKLLLIRSLSGVWPWIAGRILVAHRTGACTGRRCVLGTYSVAELSAAERGLVSLQHCLLIGFLILGLQETVVVKEGGRPEVPGIPVPTSEHERDAELGKEVIDKGVTW